MRFLLVHSFIYWHLFELSQKTLTLANLRNIIEVFAEKRGYLGVAQFGSVLEWGSRGRRFESSHPDTDFLRCQEVFFSFSPFRHNLVRCILLL